MQIESVTGLVINAPEFFQDPAFMAWLNNKDRKFSWHIPGNAVADEYSDVIVCVDPSLSGEGSDSDMPEYIWNQIVKACADHLGVRHGANHYLVRITNLEG